MEREREREKKDTERDGGRKREEGGGEARGSTLAIHESMPPIFSSVDDADASTSAPIDLPDTVTTCESDSEFRVEGERE